MKLIRDESGKPDLDESTRDGWKLEKSFTGSEANDRIPDLLTILQAVVDALWEEIHPAAKARPPVNLAELVTRALRRIPVGATFDGTHNIMGEVHISVRVPGMEDPSASISYLSDNGPTIVVASRPPESEPYTRERPTVDGHYRIAIPTDGGFKLTIARLDDAASDGWSAVVLDHNPPGVWGIRAKGWLWDPRPVDFLPMPWEGP